MVARLGPERSSGKPFARWRRLRPVAKTLARGSAALRGARCAGVERPAELHRVTIVQPPVTGDCRTRRAAEPPPTCHFAPVGRFPPRCPASDQKSAPEVVLAARRSLEHAAPNGANGLRVRRGGPPPATAQQAQSVVGPDRRDRELCRGESGGVSWVVRHPRAQAAANADLHEHDLDIRRCTGAPIAPRIAREARHASEPRNGCVAVPGGMPCHAGPGAKRRNGDPTARMTPESKVQARAEQRPGVCAMVGDGSNDAAAIRAAPSRHLVVAHGSDRPGHFRPGRRPDQYFARNHRNASTAAGATAVSVLLGGSTGRWPLNRISPGTRR